MIQGYTRAALLAEFSSVYYPVMSAGHVGVVLKVMVLWNYFLLGTRRFIAVISFSFFFLFFFFFLGGGW